MTTGVVLSRIGMAPDIRFFTPDEQAAATALCYRLLDQTDEAHGTTVPVVNLIDARLAESQTDGWHYEDMPEDGRAWRGSSATQPVGSSSFPVRRVSFSRSGLRRSPVSRNR